MSEIRYAEVLELLRTASIEGVRKDSLRISLIDRLPGIGGRFTSLVAFLESVDLIVLKKNQVFAKQDPRTISKELLISTVLASEALATDFMFHCKSVKLVSANSKMVVLNTSQVSKSFLWFILLLEQLGVFIRDHKPNFYLNPRWFDEFFAFLDLSSMRFDIGKLVSPDQYADNVQKNLKNGLAAELFIMEIEKARLSSHPLVNKITHVAAENTAAGFDILSFNKIGDLSLSRMIEVKSWTSQKEFFFSANEYAVAAKERHNYFIYLVDRKSMENTDYFPEVIRDPVGQIFPSGSDWNIEPDGWKIESQHIPVQTKH